MYRGIAHFDRMIILLQRIPHLACAWDN